jgi:multidrug efflux pump subunit AcrA (membrane-fusion protein)
MSILNKKRYKPKWLWIGLGISLAAALVIGGSLAYFKTDAFAQTDNQEPEVQTATAWRGDLTLLASGSGTLIAYDEINLGFGSNGPIAALQVEVGDVVQAGDLLAVQGDREGLKAAVIADELALLEAQLALDDFQAEADLVSAQAALALASATEALEDAEQTWQYQQEGYRASETTVKAAEAELALAEKSLEDAQEKYDSTDGSRTEDPKKAQAYKDLAAAEQRYQSALASLNWYTGHPTETDQAVLDSELALAKAQLTQAQMEYEKVQSGPDPDELSRLDLQLARAESNLALSQRDLEESTIYAPISGTILEVSADLGDNVSGAFIRMADLCKPSLEIYLDETDLDKIESGHPVEVIFDALPDHTFNGVVLQVDPSLHSSGGVSTVRAIANLEDDPSIDFNTLPIGLSAAVDVIAGNAESAVLVPVEALRELSPGEFTVFVMNQGELELRFVEVGLMDYTFAEIVSGLDAGEVVTTGIVETE